MSSMATAARHFLTGGTGGNSALLCANGSGQLDNSTAGYAVAVDGMTAINAYGHAGDTAQFFDFAGNATYYAYADYNNSGQPLAGMVGSGYSNLASGFGTNIAYSTNGGSDTAVFFDSQGNAAFYAYADYNNSGKPLAGMYGAPAIPIWPAASPPTSRIRPAAAAIRPCSSTRPATTRSIPTRITTTAAGLWPACMGADISMPPTASAATSDIRPTAAAIRPCSSTRRAMTRSMPTRITINSGQPLAGMAGSGYSNLASGFGTQRRIFDQRRQRYGRVLRFAGPGHVLCLRRLQQQRPALAGMYGTGYSNLASGFGTNVGSSTGGNATADLYGSSGNNTLYTDRRSPCSTAATLRRRRPGSRSSTPPAAAA